MVPVAHVGLKKKGSDRRAVRTKRFSASKCPKYYGSSRSIGIDLAPVCPVALLTGDGSLCERARCLAQACTPKAARCRRRHCTSPSPPSTACDRRLVAQGAPTQPNYKGASVACRRRHTTTHRPPPPFHLFTTRPPPSTGHPPSQTTRPRPAFPASLPFPHAPTGPLPRQPSPTAVDSHHVAFRAQTAGICPPPAATAKEGEGVGGQWRLV